MSVSLVKKVLDLSLPSARPTGGKWPIETGTHSAASGRSRRMSRSLRRQQEAVRGPVDRSGADDLTCVVDARRSVEYPAGPGRDEAGEVGQLAARAVGPRRDPRPGTIDLRVIT